MSHKSEKCVHVRDDFAIQIRKPYTLYYFIMVNRVQKIIFTSFGNLNLFYEFMFRFFSDSDSGQNFGKYFNSVIVTFF